MFYFYFCVLLYNNAYHIRCYLVMIIGNDIFFPPIWIDKPNKSTEHCVATIYIFLYQSDAKFSYFMLHCEQCNRIKILNLFLLVLYIFFSQLNV